MTNDLLELHNMLHDRKDDLLDLINEALRKSGLESVDIKSIRLDITKRTPVCPPGTEPVYETITLPDGSYVIQLVCK